MSVRFYSSSTSYLHKNKRKYSLWISQVFELEKKDLKSLNIVFCNDHYLLDLNLKYLKHDTLTDIITFQYENNPLEGEIYISVDRVKENADDLCLGFKDELNRVIIHGVLHLCGHPDKTKTQKSKMRALESQYMDLLFI